MQDTRSLDRAEGGIGIGLTMVRSLVNLHGGSVQAFSDGPGLGSEIVIRLPRVRDGAGDGRRPAGLDQPRPAIAPASRPLRVLVVDDNIDAATTLVGLLTLLGHRVAIAHDGPGALATATETRPDLVFVDIGLPGMDGYALATALRAAGLDRAALVAVTGYGAAEDARRSHDRGFAHHLVKPVFPVRPARRVPRLRRCRVNPGFRAHTRAESTVFQSPTPCSITNLVAERDAAMASEVGRERSGGGAGRRVLRDSLSGREHAAFPDPCLFERRR